MVQVVSTGPEVLFGLGPVEQRDGVVSAGVPTGAPYVDARGAASVGSLGVLVDNVLGYAIIGSLVDAPWSVSTEIWVDVVAPLPVDGSRLSGQGRLVLGDGHNAFAEGRVHDAAGGLVAVCRQRGRATPTGPEAVAPEDVVVPAGAATVPELIGLDLVGPDLARLTVTPALANPSGMLHGGVSLCASEVLAAHSRAEAGAATLATTSVHIVHTRGVPGGASVELTAETRHRGRTLWVTDVTARVGQLVVTTARVTAGPRWSSRCA